MLLEGWDREGDEAVDVSRTWATKASLIIKNELVLGPVWERESQSV